MVTSKPVYQFPTGSRFSERITGYQIYHTSCRHDPGNTDANVLHCRECCRQPFSRYSRVV